MKVIHEYLRKPSTGQPIGVLVAVGEDLAIGSLISTRRLHAIGVSRCKNGETFDPDFGFAVAQGRAINMLKEGVSSSVPSVERTKQYARFIKRTNKYFKNSLRIP